MDECSLNTGEREERGDEVRRLAAAALIRRERSAEGVRFEYRASAETEAALRDLIHRERECCPFLSLDLRPGPEVLVLEIGGPPGAASVLDAIYENSVPATAA